MVSLISGAYFVGNAFFANEYKQVCIIVFLTLQVSILVKISAKLGILLEFCCIVAAPIFSSL